jgi:hypothetical protein
MCLSAARQVRSAMICLENGSTIEISCEHIGRYSQGIGQSATFPLSVGGAYVPYKDAWSELSASQVGTISTPAFDAVVKPNSPKPIAAATVARRYTLK